MNPSTEILQTDDGPREGPPQSLEEQLAAQEKELRRLRGVLDICYRYAQGEGADGDCAELAVDYGGTGWEKSKECEAVAKLSQDFVQLRSSHPVTVQDIADSMREAGYYEGRESTRQSLADSLNRRLILRGRGRLTAEQLQRACAGYDMSKRESCVVVVDGLNSYLQFPWLEIATPPTEADADRNGNVEWLTNEIGRLPFVSPWNDDWRTWGNKPTHWRHTDLPLLPA